MIDYDKIDREFDALFDSFSDDYLKSYFDDYYTRKAGYVAAGPRETLTDVATTVTPNHIKLPKKETFGLEKENSYSYAMAA